MTSEQMSIEIRRDIRYEVILLGPNVSLWREDLTQELQNLFLERMLDPGIYLSIRTATDYESIDDGDIRVGVWLSEEDTVNAPEDLHVLDELIRAQIPVFPVVDSTDSYRRKVPTPLYPINGLVWSPATVGAELLAAFRLTRAVRRAFISYRRKDCCAIAIQLFEELSKKGYEAFLDTASVPPGVDFQGSLWCRMSNVDLLIFLDSPNALDSDWVHQELARAHDLGLGVLQLVWPKESRATEDSGDSKKAKEHSPFPGTELCDRFSLNASDFVPTPPTDSSTLVDSCMQLILQAAERSRIRSLSHRRRRLSDTISSTASDLKLEVSMHPVCPYAIRRNEFVVGHIIPYIGLPDALGVQEQEQMIQENRCNDTLSQSSLAIVFEGLGMDAKWDEHLEWLNQRNPIPVYAAGRLLTWMGGL
jgi:hypothetical protein